MFNIFEVDMGGGEKTLSLKLSQNPFSQKTIDA